MNQSQYPVTVTAPSNIALIKYMGKIDSKENKPTNSSLSWTLYHLNTTVRLTALEKVGSDGQPQSDRWQVLDVEDQVQQTEVESKGVQRYLKHLQFLKEKFQIDQPFLVESANNFPSDCGLASSASSFAALTMAAIEAFIELRPEIKALTVFERAELSRMGSGSSIRSFVGPWGLWTADGVTPLEFPMPKLSHQVIVISNQKKEVSSSEAHRRVVSSPKFQGRALRAESRLSQLVQSLKTNDWKRCYQIASDEFYDMHELFETCAQPFTYFNEGTRSCLKELESLWASTGDGPLVTMDAGPNIHLIYRADQKDLAARLAQKFGSQFKVIQSPELLV